MIIRLLLIIVTLSASVNAVFSQMPDSDQKPMPAVFNKYCSTTLGSNVFVFDPSMDMKEIQTVIDTLFRRQTVRRSEFSKNRFALLFKPGKYKLDVTVDYYMHVIGRLESITSM